MSPSGPRCYGSGETRPRPCPAPGDPVPTPAPEDPVPIPGILPHAAPRDPFLIPIPSPLPCSCCPSKLLFPSCPHGAPSSRSVPVPSPLCGGSRCQALLSPAPCAGMGPGPALALPGGPEGFSVPRAVLRGQGITPAKPSRVQHCPGTRLSSWARFIQLCPRQPWGQPASQPGTGPRSLGLKCPPSSFPSFLSPLSLQRTGCAVP